MIIANVSTIFTGEMSFCRHYFNLTAFVLHAIFPFHPLFNTKPILLFFTLFQFTKLILRKIQRIQKSKTFFLTSEILPTRYDYHVLHAVSQSAFIMHHCVVDLFLVNEFYLINKNSITCK